LYVYDAAGEKLSARMETDQEGIRLIVADHEAVYPITIDPFVERKKLLANDGTASDWFGRSVSVSGDTAIVGAAYDDDNGSDSGSAFIFSRDEGGADNWGFVKKLTASDAAALDRFGDSVSIDGDTAIVGAPLNDGSGIDIGSAYIFYRNQGGADNWGEVEKLTADDAYYLFGGSVSISGDTAIVGASGDDDNGTFSGSAYVFYRDQGGADNWGQVRKLTANDANNYHYFGVSVSVSGDSAIVGAYGDDDNGTGSGASYIFSRDQEGADIWGFVKKLTAFDGEAGDRFGYSVSISGDTCVVGAHLEDINGTGSGSAYLYSRNEGGVDNWGGVKVIDASDGAPEDNFGWSVSISGDTVVIGAYLDDHTWPNAGSSYIFSRNQGGLENWGEVDKLTASDAATGDAFGYGVSISRGTIIVGAAYDDDQGGDSGSAYVFVDFIIFANDFESDDTK
ncbi:MAG: FG-GAP repeat protein, partial [Lysobacterales bacterium]